MKTMTVPFLDAIEDVSAGNIKVPQSKFLVTGSLTVVDQGQELIAGYTADRDVAVKADGPLIVFGDHTRALKFVDFPFAMGADGVKVLRTREGFDPKFVYRYLQSRPIPSAGYSRHFKFLKQIQVPKPSLEEQRRIATILDHADALRTKRRQVLAHLDTLTQAIFHDMFGEMTNRPRWPVLVIGEVASTKLGKMLDTKRQTGEHVRPYLRNSNVQWFRFELQDLKTMDFNAADRDTYSLRPGDVLVCEGGQPGRSAIWRGEVSDCYFQKALHRVRLGEGVKPEYFVRAMKSIVDEGGLKNFVTSATISHLTGEKLRVLPMPIPPIHLQNEFEMRVEALRISQDTVQRALAADDQLFASLQSRAFQGKL